MLERVGVFGRVSDHVQSGKISWNEIADQSHVQVYRLPEDDKHVENGGEAFDVVVREPCESDGTRRRPRKAWGFYESLEEASEKAVALADEHDCVVWDSVYILR